MKTTKQILLIAAITCSTPLVSFAPTNPNDANYSYEWFHSDEPSTALPQDPSPGWAYKNGGYYDDKGDYEPLRAQQYQYLNQPQSFYRDLGYDATYPQNPQQQQYDYGYGYNANGYPNTSDQGYYSNPQGFNGYDSQYNNTGYDYGQAAYGYDANQYGGYGSPALSGYDNQSYYGANPYAQGAYASPASSCAYQGGYTAPVSSGGYDTQPYNGYNPYTQSTPTSLLTPKSTTNRTAVPDRNVM